MGLRSRSFAPVVDARTRVLVLGSLPGEQSLQAGRYYANPMNQFWRLLGGVVGADLQRMAYEQRLQTLLARHVGLWDVVAVADRIGSLDSAIRNHEGNDLASLHRELPELRAFGFNGGAAAKLGNKLLGDTGLPAISLPSSSSAYARMPFAGKLERWRALAAYL